MDPIDELTLTPDRSQEEAERHWTLRSARSGAIVAKVEAPLKGPPYVRPVAGGTYRVEPYGRGWRLAARATWDERVLCWYTGRWVRSGGRLLVAPDRAYDVRSALLRRLDLHVRDGDGRRIVEAQARPRRDGVADIDLRLLRLPAHEADADLLVSFVGALEILVHRMGRSLSTGSPAG